LLDLDGIVVDSYSGLSGAGRSSTQSSAISSPTSTATCAPTNIGGHRHTPETTDAFDRRGKTVVVTFIPHLVPLDRGNSHDYFCASESRADDGKSARMPHEFLPRAKRAVRPRVERAETWRSANVVRSNYYDVSATVVERSNQLVIASSSTTSSKARRDSAARNMNIMCGFVERRALKAGVFNSPVPQRPGLPVRDLAGGRPAIRDSCGGSKWTHALRIRTGRFETAANSRKQR